MNPIRSSQGGSGVNNPAPEADKKTKLAALREAIGRVMVEKTPRKGFTRSQREAVYDLQAGQCNDCETALRGSWPIDHAVTIWEGGEHRLSNWVGLCVDCHKVKTARDAARRAKVKRIIEAETEGPKPSRLQSRGFDKSLSKKFNGTVTDRKAHP